jgi:hypothetical protein
VLLATTSGRNGTSGSRERGQDADLARQPERGRPRPCELHDEPVAEGLAAGMKQRVLFAGWAGHRDRVSAQLRGHSPQRLAQRRGRALGQPFHLWSPATSAQYGTCRRPPTAFADSRMERPVDGDTTVLAGYGQHGRIHGDDPEQMIDAAAAAYIALTADLADADHLALLHAAWTAESTPARHQRYHDLLISAVPPGYRRQPGHQARWLFRTLRAAGGADRVIRGRAPREALPAYGPGHALVDQRPVRRREDPHRP